MELDEVSSEDVLFWLKKAEDWTSHGNDTRRMRDLSEHVKDMIQFLGRLNKWLKYQDSVKSALQLQPKLGHLLGRLCSLQHLLCHDPEVYSTLLSCIQALRTKNPHDGIEKRAKSWAESQIRHTVSFYNQSNPGSEVAEPVGYTSLEFNTLSTDQLISSIQRDLEHLLAEQHHFLIGLIPQSISLEEVSNMCIPLLSIASSKRLVECLILLHAQSSGDKLSDLFLERVTEMQASAYSTGCSEETADWGLNHEALVSLWQRYLPALEQEVLLLLRAFTTHVQHAGERGVSKLINARKLPKACVEHPLLYKAVDSCIQKVLWKTQGCKSVVRFLHLFQVAVNEAVLQTKCQQDSILRLFPEKMRPLVNLLALDPQVLPLEAQMLHLVSLQACLASTLADPVIANNPREMFAVWMVLVKFQQWYWAALSALVRGRLHNKDNAGERDACLALVIWFNWPLSCASVDGAMGSLSACIKIIHKCMMGDAFKAAELQRALSPYLTSTDSSDSGEDLADIVGSLLMTALYVSPCMSAVDVQEALGLLLNSTRTASSNPNKLALLLNLMETHSSEVSGVGYDQAVPTHVIGAIRILQHSLDNDAAPSRSMPPSRGKNVEVLLSRCNKLLGSP